jgi:cysteine desulfurase
MHGNPHVPHRAGIATANRMLKVEDQLRRLINVGSEGNIIWTGSGSEANRVAIDQIYKHCFFQEQYYFLSGLDHRSITNTVRELCFEKDCQDFLLDTIHNTSGIIDHLRLLDALPYKGFSSIFVTLVNNETGLLQPVQALNEVRDPRRSHLHVDACQAIGKIPVDIRELGCDSLSGSAHKLGGPKGLGFLWVKARNPTPYLGTPNVAGIYGLGVAIQEINFENIKKVEALEQLFIIELKKLLGDDCKINFYFGSKRIPGILSIQFPGVDNRVMQLELSDRHVMVSRGAACTEESSPVLLATGLSKNEVDSTIRISISAKNTEEELVTASKIIADIVRKEKNGSKSL